MFVDEQLAADILILFDDLDVLFGDGYPAAFYKFDEINAVLFKVILLADVEDPDLALVPVGMGRDDIAQQYHQVGVLVVKAPDPNMDAVLKIEPPMRTAHDAYIIIACFYEIKIVDDLVEFHRVRFVKFKYHHIVVHA